MASPVPPPVKHPAASPHSQAPGIAQNATANPNGQFTPRREFIKDQRIAHSFSLLALSGASSVRLYSFTSTIVSALRRFLDQKSLISSVREHASKHFFEFVLEGKPWANTKSIASEKLIVDILTIILHYGYVFLSTIDYGREQDDKLAVAFSRPHIQVPTLSFGAPTNDSVISLNQPARIPFAISFSSATTVRVVGPPLASTPAVLQAVRGAWPRGVVSDKKVGDSTYEFKLKGYKWFQEDTFATDSLHHILGLLGALDGHGFTLLTSLSLTNRSRVKDLWIFTGLPDTQGSGDSANSSPNNSSLELKRELSPQSHTLVPGPSPLSAGSGRGRQLPISPGIPINGIVPDGSQMGQHRRSASDSTPTVPSPLKPSSRNGAQIGLLRKPSPKMQIPVAFVPEYPQEAPRTTPPNGSVPPSSFPRTSALSSSAHQTSYYSSPPAPAPIMRSLSNPSSIGSVDMTGVGAGVAGIRRSMDVQRTPDVFYVTDGRQHGSPREYNPFSATFKPSPQPPHAAFIVTSRDRRASADSHFPFPSIARNASRSEIQDRQQLAVLPNVSKSSTLPPRLSGRRSSSTSSPRIQVYAPSPISATRSPMVGNSDGSPRSDGSPKDPYTDAPRTPTPPLLTPGTFRDSAFSSTTGWQSQEIPIAWTGAGTRDTEALIASAGGSKPHHVRHLSADTALMAGSITREETDVNYKMFPPTIREQPSQEGDEAGRHISAKAMKQPRSPETNMPNGFAAERKSEAASVGVIPTQSTKSSPSTTPGAEKDKFMPTPQRRETAMSGWVMVNVETPSLEKDKALNGRATGNGKSTPPATRPARPLRPQRSHSHSGVLRAKKSHSPSPAPGAAPATATMNAAAKSIAMMDAVAAKEEKEKSPSTFARIFHRSKGSSGSASAGNSPPQTVRQKGAMNGGVSKQRSIETEEREEKTGLRDKWKSRNIPTVSARPSNKRVSIN